MKIIIFVLLATTAALCQDSNSRHQYQNVFSRQPTIEPAPARLEPIKRAGYTISHGDAKSSVNVNLQSSSGPVYHHPETVRLADEEGFEFKPQQGYLQQALQQYQAQAPKQSFLTDLATKQYLNINPNNANPEIISQEQPQQQSYNVGYSINIANSPKLDYRNPMPKNAAHSYRQQKLLNAEVITGTHKDNVEKPNSFSQIYDFAASNVQPSTNYISPEKQSLTKVYTDVKNNHGYTWKTLSPGVEISGYHSLGNGMPNEQHSQVQSFDHAAALGRSQGFDISNVIENGKTQYQPQAYDINKSLSQASSSNVEEIKPVAKQEYDTSNINIGSFTSNIANIKSSKDDLGSNYKSEDFSFLSGPYKHTNLISTAGNFEIDKSLFDGFYKNYKPIMYEPEITLPSPEIPKNIHLNLHGAASHQFPSYSVNLQSPESFKKSVNSQSNPEMQMINQHYAFAQASSAENQYPQVQLPVNDDVKPVNEQQEENSGQQNQGGYGQQNQGGYGQQNQGGYGQQSQELYGQQSLDNYAQQSQASYRQQIQDSYGQQSEQQVQQVPLNSKPQNFKEQKVKGNAEQHKKYNPQNGPVRQYGRPIVHGNEKNYRIKTALRPPPMIIIHQKY